MLTWAEPTLHQRIWSEIENRFNFDVFGEVTLQFEKFKKRIKPDLIGFSGKEYYGFEIKLKPRPTAGDLFWGSRRARQAKAKRKRDAVALQLAKMAGSGYFDYCYLCCLKDEVPYSYSRHFIESMARISTFEEIRASYPEYDKVGILVFDRNGRLKDEPVKARRIKRSKIPKLPRDNEGFVRHHTFSKLDRKLYDKIICEGILPNPDKGKPLRIDIMCFKGSDNPSEILRNQNIGYELIGIEAKGKNFNAKDTLDELKKYIESGGLTRLYFAFPEASQNKALKLKKEIREIGLISVNKDCEIEIIREAEKIEMKYDCIKFNIGLDVFGPVGDMVKRIITVSVGWGKDMESWISLFDQTI
jgi:hypothetical protein